MLPVPKSNVESFVHFIHTKQSETYIIIILLSLFNNNIKIIIKHYHSPLLNHVLQ